MANPKYNFLCEFFNKQIYIYTIKSSATNWHYFEEKDSVINVHRSLPVALKSQIVKLKELQELSVDLNSDQVVNYVTEGKFVFKVKELKTYIQLAGVQTEEPTSTLCTSTRKNISKSSDDLVFAVGKSNPAVFLKEFEKCDDTKTDKDKLFRLRNFVNHDDKRFFSELFFKNDWSTARSAFLKKYSLAFTKNKKTELDFTFNEETKLQETRINKEIGIIKRKKTIEASTKNKQEKILAKLKSDEEKLQLERARRIKAATSDMMDTDKTPATPAPKNN